LRAQGPGFGFQGLGFKVQGLGFRDHGSGFRVQVLGFRVQGLGFRVWVPGLRVPCFGLRVQSLKFRSSDSRVQGQGYLRRHRLRFRSSESGFGYHFLGIIFRVSRFGGGASGVCLHLPRRRLPRDGLLLPDSGLLSGFGFRVRVRNGDRVEVSRFGHHISGIRFRVSAFGYQVAGFGVALPLTRERLTIFGFGVWILGSGIAFRVSRFRFWVSRIGGVPGTHARAAATG